MSIFFKVLKYLILISIALIFLYFSLSPSEYEKYSKEYQLNKPFEYIEQKYRELTFIPLSEKEVDFVNNKEVFINYPQKSIRYVLLDLGVTYNSGICTITLPLGSITDEGKFIVIADEVGGVSNYNRGILVQGTGGQLINGETSVLMKLERISLTFLFRNSSWKII